MPPSRIREWEITPVCFRGFRGLTATRGSFVLLPEFTYFGHLWHLWIYPGVDSTSEEGMVDVFLHNMSGQSIEVEFGLSVKYSDGNVLANCYIDERLFSPKDDHGFWLVPMKNSKGKLPRIMEK